MVDEERVWDRAWREAEERVQDWKQKAKKLLQEYLLYAFMVFIGFVGLGILGKDLSFKMIFNSITVGLLLGGVIMLIRKAGILKGKKK